jgi:hypothetical protein
MYRSGFTIVLGVQVDAIDGSCAGAATEVITFAVTPLDGVALAIVNVSA